MKTNMFKILCGVGIAIIVALTVFFTFSVKVPAGNSGILIDLYGDDKGVQITGLHTGRNFYNWITHDAEVYPTFIRQTEYKAVEFQDIDGLKMTANVGISYKFKEDMIGLLYESYRASSNEILTNYMTTWVRDSVNLISARYTVDFLYGEGKEQFRQEATTYLQDDLGKKGIYIEKVYFVGAFELPEVVSERINSKIEATQKAIQAENELRAVKAEAEKKIAEAEGEKISKILRAEGEAQAIKIQSEAILAQGGQGYIDLQWIGKWNGSLPSTVLGDSVPFVTIK